MAVEVAVNTATILTIPRNLTVAKETGRSRLWPAAGILMGTASLALATVDDAEIAAMDFAAGVAGIATATITLAKLRSHPVHVGSAPGRFELRVEF